MLEKTSTAFQGTVYEIQLLLEATQNLKVEENYKEINWIQGLNSLLTHPIIQRNNYIEYCFLNFLNLLLNCLLLFFWGFFLLCFNCISYSTIVPNMFPLGLLSGSMAIRYTSNDFHYWSVLTPLRKSCRKISGLMERECLSDMKNIWSDGKRKPIRYGKYLV